MKPGETRLRQTLRRLKRPPRTKPTPLQEDWAAWVERRIAALETRQKWILALSIATLATVAGFNPQLLADLIERLTGLL